MVTVYLQPYLNWPQVITRSLDRDGEAYNGVIQVRPEPRTRILHTTVVNVRVTATKPSRALPLVIARSDNLGEI